MLTDLIGKNIEIEISGECFQKGTLVDSGSDIIVLFDARTNSFLYIPYIHIHRLKEIRHEESALYNPPADNPIEVDAISFRKILISAKGLFVQVYVTGNKSIHGYLTSIMNDYFVFHSPVYKTMYIAMHHVKWLIPYPPNTTPYSLDNRNLPLIPASTSLSRAFDEQLKKFENQIVILDGGEIPEKIGLLSKVQNNKATLISAEGEAIILNLKHIKTIQLP